MGWIMKFFGLRVSLVIKEFWLKDIINRIKCDLNFILIYFFMFLFCNWDLWLKIWMKVIYLLYCYRKSVWLVWMLVLCGVNFRVLLKSFFVVFIFFSVFYVNIVNFDIIWVLLGLFLSVVLKVIFVVVLFVCVEIFIG